jgi:flagellar assembly factor FliW
VLVPSERFGDLEVHDDRVLTFPDGLLGFPEARRFAMIDTGEDSTYFWLQSVEDPGLAFLSVVPWAFFPDYAPEVDEVEQTALGLERPEDALVLCLLSVQRDTEKITANLLGPLIVNASSRRGRQVVLAESGYPVRAPLAAA